MTVRVLGITKIKYIEGLYKLWDDLIKNTDILFIDNCASGGRRIDIETLSRSIPLWHSDTQYCGYADSDADQTQNLGLSLWVPLHSCGVWSYDKYVWRSAISSIPNRVRKMEIEV